jgi:hypothetical protein
VRDPVRAEFDRLNAAWSAPAGASMSDRLRLGAQRAKGWPAPVQRVKPIPPTLAYLRALSPPRPSERPLDFNVEDPT